MHLRTTTLVLAALLLFVGMAVVTAEDPGIHARPNSVTATCGTRSADVAWDPVSDLHLSGYDVYRRPSGEPDFVKANAQLVTGTAFADTGLASSTTYEYGVKAVYNDGHTSLMSDTSSCTTT